MKTSRFLADMAFVIAIVTALSLQGTASAQMYDYGSHAMSQHDRTVLRRFIIEEHARSCDENETRRIEPCGLASRVLVSYAEGSVLPLKVQDEIVPLRVTRQIASPPQGAAYVYAGDTVYMIDVLSRRIIDTVTIATD